MTTPFASRKPATSSNKGWSGPARAQCASAGRRWAPAVQPQDVMRTPGSRQSCNEAKIAACRFAIISIRGPGFLTFTNTTFRNRRLKIFSADRCRISVGETILELQSVKLVRTILTSDLRPRSCS